MPFDLNFTLTEYVSGVTIAVTTQPDAITAPAPVWLEASTVTGLAANRYTGTTAVYDNQAHDLHYKWTVRGQPLAAFSAPVNMASWQNNPNIGYGKKVAFCFPDPGDYIIDLVVTDRNGNTAAASTSTITVIDPADRYPTTQTAVVSFDGGETWAGEPAGAQRLTTNAAIQAAINAAGPSAPLRLLFKRGQTYSTLSLEIRADNLEYIGAWGSGADPIFAANWPTSATNSFWFRLDNDMSQVTFANVQFVGEFDVTTEQGRFFSGTQSFNGYNKDITICYHNVSFIETRELSWLPTATTVHKIMVHDCNLLRNQNFGLFLNTVADGSKLALIGNRMDKGGDALAGGPKDGFLNNHGSIRIADCEEVYIYNNDMFTKGGWSALTPDTFEQPILRLNGGGTINTAGNYAYIGHNTTEGGGVTFSCGVTNTGTAAFPGNYIFEGNVITASPKIWNSVFLVDYPGITIRNNSIFVPDTPKYHASQPWRGLVNFREASTATPDATCADAPVLVYNNSTYVAKSAANDLAEDWSKTTNTPTTYSFFVDSNNLIHAPTADTPITTYAPVTTPAITGISSRYAGIGYGFADLVHNLAGDVVDGATETVAYSELLDDVLYASPAGSATDQTYWTTNGGTDHFIKLGAANATIYSHAANDFIVTFGASNITIQNNSGVTWTAGTDLIIKLDRASAIPALDTAYSIAGNTVPLLTPDTGSTALGGASGVTAIDDIYGNIRGGAVDMGAVQVS